MSSNNLLLPIYLLPVHNYYFLSLCTYSDGLDYSGGPFSVTFGSGANERQCINFTIVSDDISETSENFIANIVVTPGSGVSLGNIPSTTVAITGKL